MDNNFEVFILKDGRHGRHEQHEQHEQPQQLLQNNSGESAPSANLSNANMNMKWKGHSPSKLLHQRNTTWDSL